MKTKQTSGKKTLLGKIVKVTKPGEELNLVGEVIRVYEDASPNNKTKKTMFVNIQKPSGEVVKIMKYRVQVYKPEVKQKVAKVKPDKPKIKSGDNVRVTINSEISNTKAKVHSYIKDLNKFIVIPEKPYRRIDTLIVSPDHIKVDLDMDGFKTLDNFLVMSLDPKHEMIVEPAVVEEAVKEAVEQYIPPHVPLYLPFERVMLLLDNLVNELGPGAVSQFKNRYAVPLDNDNSPQNL